MVERRLVVGDQATVGGATEPLAGQIGHGRDWRALGHHRRHRAALHDHGHEARADITEAVPGGEVVGDAGQAEVRPPGGDPPDVLRPAGGIEDVDLQVEGGEQTVRRCRKERQVVARKSARAVQTES